jgi:hypothetical protein
LIREEIKLIKETPADLRKFGLSIGTVLIIAAVVLFLFDKSGYIYFAAAGVLFIIPALFFPGNLRLLNKLWMILAVLLGWVMTRVILIILFYLVLTPIALLARLFNKKFIKFGYDKAASTYWEKRDTDISAAQYERQF